MTEQEQNIRFQYINNEDPIERQQEEIMEEQNDVKIKTNNFGANIEFDNVNLQQIEKNNHILSINKRQQHSEANSQTAQDQRQKDRQIRKLTNVNKHLIQLLKQQNEELTKRVQKQKFRIPKKNYSARSQNKNSTNPKQLQALRKQLQNAYKQIDFYKETISILKAKQTSMEQQQKLHDSLNRLKEKNDTLEKIQKQIKTQRMIKSQQEKQLGKIQNSQMTELLQRLNHQIVQSKSKLKEAKKQLSKRQELQKKQHLYLNEIECLMRKLKKNDEKQGQQFKDIYPSNNVPFPQQEQITQKQWQQIKEKLTQQKRKYEQYGKKFTYLNYMKSKQSKLGEQLQLKYKQKMKNLQKLKSKLNEVDKLVRLRPKPQIRQRVDLKMEKLKDIISRQSTIQLTKGGIKRNIIQYRNNSEDMRQFKKWQVENIQETNRTIDLNPQKLHHQQEEQQNI